MLQLLLVAGESHFGNWVGRGSWRDPIGSYFRMLDLLGISNCQPNKFISYAPRALGLLMAEAM